LRFDFSWKHKKQTQERVFQDNFIFSSQLPQIMDERFLDSDLINKKILQLDVEMHIYENASGACF